MSMSEDALPCFVCGKALKNVLPDSENQPDEGTEFRTYGHYGSTMWDSFSGEELILNVCDPCLRERTGRLAQQKRYLPVRCEGFVVGREWVQRPMVPYTGSEDNGVVGVDIEELGRDYGTNTEWDRHLDEVVTYLKKEYALEGDG